MEIVPFIPLRIPRDNGIVVEIDIDIEKSIQNDEVGRPIFSPEGDAVQIKQDTHPDGVEVPQVKGKIVDINAKDKRFLLKYDARKLFVSVDAKDAQFFNFDEKVDFQALEKGQTVEVAGVMTHENVLKATRVLILPALEEESRFVRGVMTNLNRTTNSFELEDTDSDSDSDIDSNTDSLGKITVEYSTRTKILLKRPHKELSEDHLTNGQRVGIRGLKGPDKGRIEASLIIIKPEKFKAVIVSTDCPNQIRITYPLREVERLRLAGISIGSDNIGIVEIGGAKLLGEKGAEILCTELKEESNIRILGQIAPSSIGTVNLIQVNVLKIK